MARQPVNARHHTRATGSVWGWAWQANARGAAAASTIVDVTLEFLAQIIFTAFAVVWLVHLSPDAWIEVPVTIGLAVAIILAAGALVAQRYGFDLFDRFAGTIGRGEPYHK